MCPSIGFFKSAHKRNGFVDCRQSFVNINYLSLIVNLSKTEAQKGAFYNPRRRRGISVEDLEEMALDACGLMGGKLVVLYELRKQPHLSVSSLGD